MTTLAILGMIPGLQATALVTYNLKQINMNLKPNKKMRISPKKIIKMGVTSLVGISLMKPTAKIISGL